MKTPAAILLAALLSFASSAGAQTAVDASTTHQIQPGWKPPAWWPVTPEEPAGVALGQSDYRVSGPLVETFRLPQRRRGIDRTFGQRFLDLPIINLFVPQAFPKPEPTRVYFAWGNRATPWADTVDRPIPGPQGALISVSR